MAEEMDGEEFVVDKILDKRVRNGKIEYYLSWKVIYKLSNTSFPNPLLYFAYVPSFPTLVDPIIKVPAKSPVLVS